MSTHQTAVTAAQAAVGFRHLYLRQLIASGIPRSEIADLERQISAGAAVTMPPHLAELGDMLALLGNAAAHGASLKTTLQLGLWEQHKIIYRLDADLANDLATVSDKDVLHRDVLHRLPHPDPYIHLPNPIIFTGRSGQATEVRGFFISGVRYDADSPMICSTHHPQRQYLALLFPRLPYDTLDDTAAGHETPEYEFSRIQLLFPGATATLGELIADTQRRFRDHTGDMPREDVARLLRASIAPILYTCTVNPDIRQTAAGRSKRHRRQGKAVAMYDLGYRLGSAIRSWKAERASVTATTGSGSTKRPHWRKPHLHTFRTGVGRTETVMHYISGIPVNGYTGADKPVVIPVRK
ncbi:hypothetical protein AB0B66_10630 [Catellatospora sp. NPDC049111]|uniref:hypothetical protein n=1 Tax=Catellatospora sp. NPDC049111 TaxID=3155271 RepID=UPI0034054EB9